MQLALRVCWSALPRRAFHPVVSYSWRRGFLSPTLWIKCVGRSVRLLWLERRSGRAWKTGASPGNEEPCWLSGRQGSRNFDDLCQILNYLLASLVRSSFAELGRVLVAWTPNPNPGLPMRTDIPAQRNHEGACECFGYVLSEVIGNEVNARYALVLRTVNQKV